MSASVVSVVSVVSDAAVVDTIKTETSSDSLKSVLQTLTEQSSVIKGLVNTVRQLIKDHDRQSKELEKLRNKRGRVKAERSANSLPSGITKPVAISDELAKFLGKAVGSEMARTEVSKEINAYIREKGLQDKENGRKIHPDASLSKLLALGSGDELTYFNLQRYMKHHFVKEAAVAAA